MVETIQWTQGGFELNQQRIKGVIAAARCMRFDQMGHNVCLQYFRYLKDDPLIVDCSDEVSKWIVAELPVQQCQVLVGNDHKKTEQQINAIHVANRLLAKYLRSKDSPNFLYIILVRIPYVQLYVHADQLRIARIITLLLPFYGTYKKHLHQHNFADDDSVQILRYYSYAGICLKIRDEMAITPGAIPYLNLTQDNRPVPIKAVVLERMPSHYPRWDTHIDLKIKRLSSHTFRLSLDRINLEAIGSSEILEEGATRRISYLQVYDWNFFKSSTFHVKLMQYLLWKLTENYFPNMRSMNNKPAIRLLPDEDSLICYTLLQTEFDFLQSYVTNASPMENSEELRKKLYITLTEDGSYQDVEHIASD